MAPKQIVPIVARAGYGARGVIYLIVGIFALLPAIGTHGNADKASTKGALEALLAQPAGSVLLGIVALGLVAFALWRLLQAVANADGHDRDLRGWTVRAGMMVSAATHLALAAYAVSLLVGGWGGNGGGGGGSKQEVAAWLLRQPFGPWLVAALGGVVAGAGLVQVWKGASLGYAKWLDVPRDRQWLTRPICTFGLIARGIVFCVVGGLFLYAAFSVDPNQAGGLPEAVSWMRKQMFGLMLLAVIAVGLFAFGLYSIFEAAYRKVGLDPPRQNG